MKESAQPINRVRLRFSTGFKFFLLATAGVLVLVGGIFVAGAAQVHAQVDHLARNQLFVVMKDIAGGTPVEFATDQVTISQPLGTTSFPVHESHRFVMQVAARDGYVWRYNSETGFSTGSCTSIGCWFGLPIRA